MLTYNYFFLSLCRVLYLHLRRLHNHILYCKLYTKDSDWDTDSGEPNNMANEELCACHNVLNGKLHDISCSIDAPFICAYCMFIYYN